MSEQKQWKVINVAGGGQLIQRGDRTFLLRVYKGRDGKGKRKFIHKTIHGTRRDAERELRKLMTSKDTGQLLDPSNETVAKYLERWLSAVKGRVRTRTYHDYRSIAERYLAPENRNTDGAKLKERRQKIDGIGHIKLSRLMPMDVQQLYTDMQTEYGLSARTIRYAHAVLRSALKQAVKWRILSINPADMVTLPKQSKRELQVLSLAQAKVFLAVAEQDRFHALWVVLLTTGMRPGEALALRWADLVDGRLSIHRSLVNRAGIGRLFETPKTNKSRRSVPLGESALSALQSQRRKQAAERLKAGAEYENNGLIFADMWGRPLDSSRLSRKFKTLAGEAGVFHLRMYDLRHSQATLMLAAGVPLKVISERLGHANISMTADTYMAVLPDMQQQAVVSFEKLLTQEKDHDEAQA
ncbi:tyrosine-type recombinase/integrase [soil metagenome]